MSKWFKFLVIGAAILSFSAVGLGIALNEKALLILARLVSQTGTINAENLAKVQSMPGVLLVLGTEMMLLVLVLFLYRKRAEGFFYRFGVNSSHRQKTISALLILYGFLGLMTLDYFAVSLNRQIGRIFTSKGELADSMAHPELVSIVENLKRSTPASACILVKTNRDLKYTLNYDLYPRRFYFYPDSAAPVSTIPASWLGEHQIGWILEISEQDPLNYSLKQFQQSR